MATMLDATPVLALVPPEAHHLAFALLRQAGGPLDAARAWADLVYKLVFIIVPVATAVWAYYKFVRGRTFRRRLTTSVSGVVRRDPSGGTLYLFATVEMENVGLSRFGVLQESTALGVLTHALRAADAPTEARRGEWQELGFWRVFEDQEALEPGESASEEILLEIPDANYAALRLELWVHSPDEVPWKGTAVVNLLPEEDNDEPPGAPSGREP